MALAEAPSAAQDNYNSIDKGIFIRALSEVRARNPGTALAEYIEEYITVQVPSAASHSFNSPTHVVSVPQFNSLLENARAPNTDFYAPSWSAGPSDGLVIFRRSLLKIELSY